MLSGLKQLPVPPSYIVTTTSSTLVSIKSCDLNHRDIQALEFSALAQANLHQSQRNTEQKRKRQQTGKYWHLNPIENISAMLMQVVHILPATDFTDRPWESIKKNPSSPSSKLCEHILPSSQQLSGFWVGSCWHDTAHQGGQAKERMLHKGSASYSSFHPESTAVFYNGSIKLLTGRKLKPNAASSSFTSGGETEV